MAQLIDLFLVVLAVGAAVWYTMRYFIDLASVPSDSSQGCSGCSGGCHPTSVQSDLIAIQNKK